MMFKKKEKKKETPTIFVKPKAQKPEQPH